MRSSGVTTSWICSRAALSFRSCSRLGLDVYAIDWGHPSRGDRWMTLDDHVNILIDDCVDAICERHGTEKVNLLSICQGGVFNLCYTALHPKRVKNLVLTVTPVDFHGDLESPEAWRGFVNVWTRACKPEDIDLAVDALGNLPGPLNRVRLLDDEPDQQSRPSTRASSSSSSATKRRCSTF